jgi:hypothetical protein
MFKFFKKIFFYKIIIKNIRKNFHLGFEIVDPYLHRDEISILFNF